jgi:hypothetical protein
MENEVTDPLGGETVKFEISFTAYRYFPFGWMAMLPPNPELRSALASAFGTPGPAAASEGDLARAALDLLRKDPALGESIQLATIRAGASPSSQRYFEPLTIGLATAAVLALQTRVKFKMDHKHNWSVEVDKKSSSDATVKLLVQRLLPFLGK